jgi:LacI family transcriptional regulator
MDTPKSKNITIKNIKKGINVKTIAELANVSPVTVSRILRGKNKRITKTTEKIKSIAQQLGYKKNLIARSLKTGKSWSIGVLISEINSSFFPEIIDGIESVLYKKGYGMILANTHENPEIEAQGLHNFVSRQVNGIIISPIIDNINEQYFWELKQREIPLVVIDRKYPFVQCDFVGVEDKLGAKNGVNYLIKSGHIKIGMLTGPLNSYTGKERLEGYKEALMENGIEFKKRYIVEGSYVNLINIGIEKGKELIQKSPDITAIFCGTDETAIGVIKYLKKIGKKIPEDISILGFGDLPIATMVEPQLTTIKQPLYEIGKQAALLLCEKIEETNKNEKQTILLKTELIIRESTKKIINSSIK